MQWTVGIMWSTGHLMLIFVLFIFTSFTQAYKLWEDMNWERNPAESWPYTIHQCEHKVVLILLNERVENKDWTIIASGVIIDNSRILTTYNPFKELLSDPKAENIVVVVPTGREDRLSRIKIVNLVCARRIVYEPDEENKASFWHNKEHCPTHDLMIMRMEEEFGIANATFRREWCAREGTRNVITGNFFWAGQIKEPKSRNVVISIRAGYEDTIATEILIFTLGYMSKKQMKDFDTIHEITFDADDAALVDCDEWLPRQWGFFICVRNIGNFPGLGSGATLSSKHKLFGIGSFALFKNDTGILVFTDLRPYKELIDKTCGDEEFI